MKNLFFAFMALVTILSCEKLEELPSEKQQIFVENSEEIKDGVLYIDGTAQIDRIQEIQIMGVSVIEGRFRFENATALFDAIEVLSSTNDESRINFYQKQGVKTLLNTLDAFDQLYDSNETVELKSVVEKHYFAVADNEASIQAVSYSIAQVLNELGMVQVGDYVGAFRGDELIWTKEEHAKILEKAILTNNLSKHPDFVRIRHSNSTRDWINFTYCPKDNTWIGPLIQYKNPNAVRRIDVQGLYERFIIPRSNGNYDMKYVYTVKSTSRKQSWNKYKTNHYHSADIIMNEVVNGVEYYDVSFSKVRQHNSTKVANTQIIVNYDTNVPYGHWNSHFLRLSYVNPGSSGQQGTAASHQGMGGLYGRLRCD